MSLNKASAWFLALRPKTLSAAFVPVLVGTALVYAQSPQQLKIHLSLFALVSALFIQIGTNLVNDAADFQKGADTPARVGPTRVTQKGLLRSKTVWLGAALSFLIAVFAALPLIQEGGFVIVAIGLCSIFCAYIYTAGPWPLAYLGLGEIFVILFFGFAALCGTCFLHTGFVTQASLVAALQIGFLSTVLIAINNARDAATDVLVHKRTLAVRFGERFAKREIVFFMLSPFLLNIYWVIEKNYWAAFLPFLMLPFAMGLSYRIMSTPPGTLYNNFLAKAALLQILFSLLLSLGLCL